MTPRIRRLLGGFRNRVARQLSGKFPRRQADGTWEFSPLGDAMRAAGLEEIETYVSRRQSTVAQYIATRPIIDLCLDTERIMG